MTRAIVMENAERDSLLERLLEQAEAAKRAEPRPSRELAGLLPAPRPQLPERYRDVKRLGGGGMGEVRLTRDISLRRNVAMKVLATDTARSPMMVQTFVEEARTIAQLDHPHIPPVYELGADEHGVAFFTMKVVKGTTLWEKLRKRDAPPGSPDRLREGVEILVKICDALAFAHARGVIHRDLKSDNIMLGEFGEVYLMDWGLAKVMRERATTTVDIPRPEDTPLGRTVETIVGTPAYMAPELAVKGAHVDERADVFGVGAVLYEIVTGRYPFPGSDESLVLEAVRACDFVPPQEAAPNVFIPKQIVNVIMKAMARDPSERYACANDVKRDLQRFLQGGLYLPRTTHPAGTTIVREGEPGDTAFIVTRGECDVFKTVDGQPRHLRRMGPRSVFGEAAVLSNAPRSATVVAATEVTLLTLSRDVIEEGLTEGSWETLLVKCLLDRFRELEESVHSQR